jgi:hypothetical protein
VLQIQDVYPGYGSENFSFRIPDPDAKALFIPDPFSKKTTVPVFLLLMVSVLIAKKIIHTGSRILKKFIPGQGVKKHRIPDPDT